MLAILYRVAKNTPILLAANREEDITRPRSFPRFNPARRESSAASDKQAGGTWLGVNQFGLVVAVTNRARGAAAVGAAVARAALPRTAELAKRP